MWLSKVEGLEARVGRKGHIKVRGGLPVTPSAAPLPSVAEPSGRDKEAEDDSISIDVKALEVRVRNVYTGQPTTFYLSNPLTILWY